MVEKRVFDVVCVGGGIVGLHISKLLAEEGLEVLLLDEKEEIGKDVVCSGVIGKSCLIKFPFLKNFIVNKISEVKLISPSGTVFHYRHPSPLAYVTDREKVDRYLGQLAISKGVILKLKRKVVNVLVNKRSVEVIAESCGEKESYSGKVLVIATGYKTLLLKRIGLGYPKSFVIAAKTEIKTKWNEPLTIFVGSQISKGGFGWVIPLRECSEIGTLSEVNAQKGVREILKRSFGHEEIEEIKSKPIAQGFVPKTYGERMIAVGEAAGQVKTTTGGGIYFGLLCSEIGAETIAEAFKKGDFREKIFSRYEMNWKRIIGNEIKWGLFLRKMFSKIVDSQIDKLVKLALGNGLVSYIAKKAKFDEHVNALLELLEREEIKEILEDIKTSNV